MITLTNERRYLNNNRPYDETFNDELLDMVPNITVIENGYILPKSDKYLCKGGVTDNDHNFIEESSIINNGSFICINGSYDFSEDDTEYFDEEVIYLGYYFRHWGHFLMDCTTRMWILCSDAYSNLRVVFPNHPQNVCDGNYARFLELAGINDRIIRIQKPTRFRKILIPQEARSQPDKKHMACYYDIFDKVIKRATYDPEKVPRKVYFSRGKMVKPELGEPEIEYNYSINGYTVVYPELLTLDEQIGIFQEAEEIVSQNSSICMNVVFARSGLKWTVINKYDAIHDAFTELRYCKDIDLTYVDAHSGKLNFFGSRIGSLPYLVSFNDNMVRLFDDRGMRHETFNYIYRIKNVAVYLIRSLMINPKRKMRHHLEAFVRWMKKQTPGVYAFLKKAVS